MMAANGQIHISSEGGRHGRWDGVKSGCAILRVLNGLSANQRMSRERTNLIGFKSAAFTGNFGEALRTADGGNIRPIVTSLLDGFLQLAAFIAAIQDTDHHRSAVRSYALLPI
jgi:hypothetical protein